MYRDIFTYMQTHIYIYMNTIRAYIYTGKGTSRDPDSDCPPYPTLCGSRALLGQQRGRPHWKVVFLTCKNVNIYFWLLCTLDFST